MIATFREATAEDLAKWLALRKELWPECSIERHELEIEQLTSSEGLVVFADVNNDLVGFAEVSIRRDHVEGTSHSPVPYLEGWYVREAFRDKGIGSGLLSYVEEWAVSKGYRQLASDAELVNTLSIDLHRRLGFSEVGRSVHFVKGLESPAP